ncbi:MAG: TonB-dependent receptor [Balneolaceae bacterium]|nr:TonB-dependent receptor [Balneolaceae bacterium]MBO6546888.1 TonB-dependent receptor [Balneolaceae bacterium]MBO6649248.1 TonB-dependent receptor [Balneolaceae bacterium]
MLKSISAVLFILLFSLPLYAQNSFRAYIIDHESEEPLIGVSVYFPVLETGGTTNGEGYVEVRNIPDGELEIIISYVGYETLSTTLLFPLSDELQNQVFELDHSHEEFEEIVVNSTRSSRTIEDSPTRVEFIAGEELAEKGNMKPGDIRMLLNESTGIQTQQTSATSYNSSIRIQGLDGKYTQLLRDGLPLYSGFSGGLSLMQIAPLDLKQVEVIKGASSTLYGGGAISGLVNLITKSPEDKPEMSVMLNGTSAAGFDGSAFYSERYGTLGTTVFASYNKGTAYDPADIGLTAIPEFDRFTLNPKLFFYLGETTLNVGVNIVSEERLGGNIAFIEGEDVADPYFEDNETNRISSQFQLQHTFDSNTALTLKNSVSWYDRSVEIPDYIFSGTQFSSFSEANLSLTNENAEWILGLNLWTDTFDQSEGSNGNPLNFSDLTFGVFAQNTTPLNSLFTLETGFRLDIHDEYGLFPLPRISLLAEPNEQLTFRLGGGLGYKTPTVFTEDAERIQFRNILPLDTNSLEEERSTGANFDINYRYPITSELILSSNILFFYTRIDNPLVLTPSGSNFEYTQPDGFVDTKGVEVNLKWSYKDLKLFVGYTHANVQQHYNGQVTDFPLVAEHRLNNVLMYEKHGDFWIGLEAYYFSPQKLGDGSTGKSYWITGLMTEKKILDQLSVFLNFENFLDTRQTAFDTIYTGSIDDPEFRDIYAPVDGFVVNGGVKLTW